MNALAWARPDADAIGLAAIERQGPVAVLRIDRPCPTAWDGPELDLFCRALTDLGARADVAAIVLHGEALFREADDQAPVDIRLAVEAVAQCRKPVYAAIAGDAVGAGLELALACAGRTAAPGARMWLPALQMGRLPTHGAVERLPRLIGMAAAADLLIFGEVVTATTAAGLGLVDVVAADVLAAAVHLAARDRGAPRCEAALPPDSVAELFGVRMKLRRLGPQRAAPLAACQALETAATLPLRRAFVETGRIAERLARSDEARALAYAAAAQRELAGWGGLQAQAGLAVRLRWPLLREAIHLLDEGATPPQIDRVLTAYGFAEGPFAQSDREGLDAVFLAGAPEDAGPTWLSYSPTLDLMLDAQRRGGEAPGWCKGAEDDPARRVFDPEVGRLLDASATFQRLPRRSVTDETVLSRCLLAAINGAAELLQSSDQGLSAAAIDGAWSARLGFPAWKGGPLRQAGAMGLDVVVADLKALHARRNTSGAPAAILERCAARGEALA